MSRWFRHYTGMIRDPKFSGIAARNRQPVERVVFVWSWMLESACEQAGGGTFSADCDEIAYLLRCDPNDISSIVQALADARMILAGVIAKWSARQFESDSSKERVAKHRAKKAETIETPPEGSKNPCNAEPPLHNADETPPDTDTDTESSVLTNGQAALASEPDDLPVVVDLPVDPDAELFRVGRELLGKTSGGQIAKLKAHFCGDIEKAREVLELSRTKFNRAEYIAAVIRGRTTGPPVRRDPRVQAFEELKQDFAGWEPPSRIYG